MGDRAPPGRRARRGRKPGLRQGKPCLCSTRPGAAPPPWKRRPSGPEGTPGQEQGRAASGPRVLGGLGGLLLWPVSGRRTGKPGCSRRSPQPFVRRLRLRGWQTIDGSSVPVQASSFKEGFSALLQPAVSDQFAVFPSDTKAEHHVQARPPQEVVKGKPAGQASWHGRQRRPTARAESRQRTICPGPFASPPAPAAEAIRRSSSLFSTGSFKRIRTGTAAAKARTRRKSHPDPEPGLRNCRSANHLRCILAHQIFIGQVG